MFAYQLTVLSTKKFLSTCQLAKYFTNNRSWATCLLTNWFTNNKIWGARSQQLSHPAHRHLLAFFHQRARPSTRVWTRQLVRGFTSHCPDDGDTADLRNSGTFKSPNAAVSPTELYWVLSPPNYKTYKM